MAGLARFSAENSRDPVASSDRHLLQVLIKHDGGTRLDLQHLTGWGAPDVHAGLTRLLHAGRILIVEPVHRGSRVIPFYACCPASTTATD